jgi:pullulanase
VQVDGFRFDIMGHHFVSNMSNIRNALNALTVERDGVDGRHIYIYGEAWDFGEVALNQRGRNASQHNLVSKGGVEGPGVKVNHAHGSVVICSG